MVLPRVGGQEMLGHAYLFHLSPLALSQIMVNDYSRMPMSERDSCSLTVVALLTGTYFCMTLTSAAVVWIPTPGCLRGRHPTTVTGAKLLQLFVLCGGPSSFPLLLLLRLM
ncbi:hypothetical protein L202_07159 [Cryptococcus amylolentus CBS 6039]|uniref:Uncharacterized protein n=1 Tax=Cryptococcus amylolentus CBS 6039 TaxID=1295533 RepID=A0A1E3HEW3_9TREE|nr:hypothetical protein L202_07159 [Cryptococcus amylolentus CBS 6039]ODN74854.1 hypothetical protein L202_07159 [Cryptococcus amylolentus CBS 6039]